VTGGTGFIGQRVVTALLEQEDQVQVLTRNPKRAETIWGTKSAGLTLRAYDPLDPASWVSCLEGIEGIIHLAGEPLATGRWTANKKAEIRRSRVESTQCLVKALAMLSERPQVLVSASAVGYYGPHTDDTPLTEADPAGQDFLASVTQDWETAAQAVEPLGIRCVVVRTGIVLGLNGGALAQMLGPFQAFIGGPIGSGEQWFSWIHREDLVRLIIYLLKTDTARGAWNGTAPEPVPMKVFCQTLGQVMGRPSWLPVPAFALELLLGEAAQVVLTGQRVLPARAQASDFLFQYPTLRPALQNIVLSSL
jgi:uncharacterized protein (TIGR01777 family)